MESIDRNQRAQLRECLTWFRNEIHNRLLSIIRNEVPHGGIPAEFTALDQLLVDAQNELGKARDLGPVSEEQLPTLKRVVMARRASLAAEIEEEKRRTFHVELLAQLDQKLQAFDTILEDEQMRRVQATSVPQLSDYLSIKRIVELGLSKSLPSGRIYDEKFHTLQAPQQFLGDLKQMRQECGMRRRPVAVAYLDIDDFKKKFNTPLRESVVDRDVLPPFMQEIEGCVFCHGYAYRFGGDEYVLLLPNQNRDSAIAFVNDLRSRLVALTFRSTKEKTTVSIGIVLVEPDSALTELEMQHKANAAKDFAKSQGKNCIATFPDPTLDESSLHLVARE